MEQLTTAFVFALILTLWMNSSGTETISLQQKKLSIIKREAALTTDAVQHLTIKTPQDKVQLTSLAADFVLGFTYATYSLNNVVANIFDEKEHKALVSVAQALSTSANDVQQSILSHPEKLIEKLVKSLENIVEAINCLEEHIKGCFNNFVNVQLDRMNNILYYAIYKLKFETILFKKSNAELEPEMNEAFTLLSATLNSLQCLNAATENELFRFLQVLSIYSERNSYKFQNWVEVNPDNADDVEVVTESFIILSTLYGKEIHAISGKFKISYIRDQILKIYKAGLKQAIAIACVEYPDHLGGQEFLRSSIIDVVILGNWFAETSKDLLSNTCDYHDHVH